MTDENDLFHRVAFTVHPEHYRVSPAELIDTSLDVQATIDDMAGAGMEIDHVTAQEVMGVLSSSVASLRGRGPIRESNAAVLDQLADTDSDRISALALESLRFVYGNNQARIAREVAVRATADECHTPSARMLSLLNLAFDQTQRMVAHGPYPDDPDRARTTFGYPESRSGMVQDLAARYAMAFAALTDALARSGHPLSRDQRFLGPNLRKLQQTAAVLRARQEAVKQQRTTGAAGQVATAATINNGAAEAAGEAADPAETAEDTE